MLKTTTNSIPLIRLSFLVIALLQLVSQLSASDSKPNVVIVITDDQGYGDLSCHGNPILKTPKLDELYEDSIRLTDYHVSPTCSPTRAALQTGHWSNRTGVWHTIMGRSLLRKDEITMGDVFQAAGYQTGMFGKWHLGDNYPFRPEDRGYVEVFRHGGGGVGQAPDYWDNAYFAGHYWHNGKPKEVNGYCTDEFFGHAKRFISDCKQKGRPFLAYISTNAPHGPFHSPHSYSAPYKEQSLRVANFFGMIANIDENVGQLREFLKQEELDHNTIFIFTTDNGTAGGAQIFNAGMRAAKGSEYDGGHRVPFFIRWPAGRLKGGRDLGQLVAHVDVLPTLIDLCDLEKFSDVAFDGQSISPLLQGEKVDWPDRAMVTDSQRLKNPKKWKQSAVMTSRWRLVNKNQLYDIKADPGQKNDIAKNHPDTVARLQKFYESWWSEIEPTFKKSARIIVGHSNENPVRLSSHDWICEKYSPWNQAQVRQAFNDKDGLGYWNIEVHQEGTYQIRLRRWPPEIDHPINSRLPAGEPVPGTPAFRDSKGVGIAAKTATLKLGDHMKTAKVDNDDSYIAFQLDLKPGAKKLEATFQSDDGNTYGAFYVDVEFLNNQ
ncbi:MAG: arylsulfatase [Planctomycetota bacterium]